MNIELKVVLTDVNGTVLETFDEPYEAQEYIEQLLSDVEDEITSIENDMEDLQINHDKAMEKFRNIEEVLQEVRYIL